MAINAINTINANIRLCNKWIEREQLSQQTPALHTTRTTISTMRAFAPAVPRPVTPSTFQSSLKPIHKPTMAVCTQSVNQTDSTVLTWQGHDEFTGLGDREDKPPLPLPELDAPKRVVLVRHGQSTWNAEGRIQGSSDFSVLTEKGIAQAQTTKQMVHSCCFLYTPAVSTQNRIDYSTSPFPFPSRPPSKGEHGGV